MDFLSADSLVLAFLIAVLKMEVSWSFSAIPWQNWPRFVPLFFGKSLFQMGHLQFQELVRLSSCFLNFPIQDCNYIYYIYTIYIYTYIYIYMGSWDSGILPRVAGSRWSCFWNTAEPRHRSSARHLARTIRDFLSQKQVPCCDVVIPLGPCWVSAKFKWRHPESHLEVGGSAE
jgi:hypothetical protein